MNQLVYLFVLGVVGLGCMSFTYVTPQDPAPISTQLHAFEEQLATRTFDLQQGQSLYVSITQKAPDSMKAIYYNRLAYALTGVTVDSSLFLKTNRAALITATRQRDTLAMADANWNYGIYYLNRLAYEKSYSHYRAAYGFFKDRHPYYAGKMLYNMAYIRGRIKDYTGSEVLLYQAIALFKKVQKPKQLYLCYNHLGAIYDNLNDIPTALKAYQTALTYLENLEDPWVYYEDVHNNLGVLYQKTGDQKRAIQHFDKALNHKNIQQKDAALYARLLDNRAYSTLLQNNNSKVLEAMNTALHIRDSLQNTAGQLISHLHLATYYAKQTDTLTALTHARRAYTLGQTASLHRDALQALLLLADIDPDKQVDYLKKYIALHNKVDAMERNVRNKFTRIHYETEFYKKANEQLKREQLWIMAGGLAIVIILILSIIIYRQRAINKALAFETQQQQADEQIYLLTLKQQANLEKGRLQERRRIAEDLHDGILARLFAVRLHWDLLPIDGAPKTIAKHQEHLAALQEIEAAIRNVSHDLKHEFLQVDNPYLDTLKTMVHRWSESGGFSYHFKASPEAAWETLDQYVKVNVYRIIKEALQNTTKHAAATYVTVILTIEQSLATIEITDNGKGFTPRYTTRGIGLKNIASRITKIKGRLSLDSSPGTGTRVFITFPKPDAL